MNKVLSLIGLTILMLLGWAAPALADPEPNPGVCPEGGAWSVHLSANDLTSFSFTAPTGFAVAELCVKAGSLNQELGPEFSTFDPAVVTVTFGHSSGKEISHFSVRVVPVTVEEEPTTTTTTTVSPTTLTLTPTTADPGLACFPDGVDICHNICADDTAPCLETVAAPETPELARTGSDDALALSGLALVAGGAALVAYARSRQVAT